MRKIYDEFFYIPKYGKIREKVILSRVVTTISTVIMCLAAMSITAYAYFSCNITSGSNVIKAANFNANVSITGSNNEPIVVTKDGKTQTANLEAGQYTITLTSGNSTAHKGFCAITINEKKYYTDQIGVDMEKNLTDASVKFDLSVSVPTKIEILSHWGTSVYYGCKDAGIATSFIVDGEWLDLTDTNEQQQANNTSDITTSTPSANTMTENVSSKPTSSTETTSDNVDTNVSTESNSSALEPTQTTQPLSTEIIEELQPVTEAEDTKATGSPVTEERE